LTQTLETICNKHNVLFLNPVKEFTARGYDVNECVVKENLLSHYNDKGHSIMKEIYKDYLQRLIG
jgi:hypothetical protein